MGTQFQPRDKVFEEKVRDSFHRQQAMKLVNASLGAIRPGEVEIEFPFQPSLTQHHGFIHAGIVSTVLDSACGYAAFSLMPEGAAVLTIEFKVHLLAPAKGQHFRAVGKVKKPGRTITVTEGELYVHSDGGPKLTATMTGTMMSVYDHDGITN